MRTTPKQMVNEQIAQVIDFENGRGHAIVLKSGSHTDRLITFHFDDGRFLWTDYDHIEWEGSLSPSGEPLETPRPNDLIVFTLCDDGQVDAWTYESIYHECEIDRESYGVRLRAGNIVQWRGRYSPRFGDVVTRDGQLPREFEEGMIMEINHSTVPLSDSDWETAFNQEQLWMNVVSAQKQS